MDAFLLCFFLCVCNWTYMCVFLVNMGRINKIIPLDIISITYMLKSVTTVSHGHQHKSLLQFFIFFKNYLVCLCLQLPLCVVWCYLEYGKDLKVLCNSNYCKKPPHNSQSLAKALAFFAITKFSVFGWGPCDKPTQSSHKCTVELTHCVQPILQSK